ncbi:MAG TPA: SOS response-associated peptidase [Metabacillus sp.]|nr:SOS response-associated peptidase [Metabacillus sp.]
MCGRFSLATEQSIIEEQFDVLIQEELLYRYNVAPSQNIFVIGSNGQSRTGTFMRWGLVPPWSKDVKIGYKMINARSETIDKKVSFKTPFIKKRCLIISDGFYEWKKSGKEKQPFRFIMKDRKPFAFAGLWECWKQGEHPLFTCTILTTEANKITEDVHDRMPVILPYDSYATWLDPNFHQVDQLKSLLVPYDEGLMEVYQVSNLVNSPAHDVKECLEPINSI